MNQEKIGKFIAEQRTKKNLTQQELANKLNVTNKAVSKWENGKSLPDVGLFETLCKELDISLNELLSGEKIEKSNNKDKATMSYLKHIKKKNKLITTISLIILFISIIFIGLLIYFFNNYNKIKIYNLSGESRHFIYSDSLFINTNQKYFLTYGKLDKKNPNLDLYITKISLRCDDEEMISTQYNNGSCIEENKGYNEIFNDKVVKNIDNWGIVITYIEDGKEKEETIDLQNELQLTNNKFINHYSDSISDGKKTDDSLVTETQNDLKVLETFLKKNNYTENEEDNYIKATKDGEYSSFLNPYDYYLISFCDGEYIIQIDPFHQVYRFVEKNLGYVAGYVRKNNSLNCSYGECPLDMQEKINKYINMFDKEFKEIIPSKDKWASLVTDDEN